MTTRVVKTTEEEARDILDGRKRFIFRSDKIVFNKHDIIEFAVVKNGKMLKRGINDKRYVVTMVLRRGDAPIEEGYQLIGFRDISKL